MGDDFELDLEIERADLGGELTLQVGVSGPVRCCRACG